MRRAGAAAHQAGLRRGGRGCGAVGGGCCAESAAASDGPACGAAGGVAAQRAGLRRGGQSSGAGVVGGAAVGGLRRGGRCCGVANRASEARRTVHLRCGRGCCTADGAAVRRAKLLSGGWNVCGAANGRKGSGCCVAAAGGTSAWRREPLLYSPRPSHGQYNQDLFL